MGESESHAPRITLISSFPIPFGLLRYARFPHFTDDEREWYGRSSGFTLFTSYIHAVRSRGSLSLHGPVPLCVRPRPAALTVWLYNVMGLVCSARTLATLVDQTRPFLPVSRGLLRRLSRSLWGRGASSSLRSPPAVMMIREERPSQANRKRMNVGGWFVRREVTRTHLPRPYATSPGLLPRVSPGGRDGSLPTQHPRLRLPTRSIVTLSAPPTTTERKGRWNPPPNPSSPLRYVYGFPSLPLVVPARSDVRRLTSPACGA